MAIAPTIITTSPLTPAYINIRYAVIIETTGDPVITWALSGILPPGLTTLDLLDGRILIQGYAATKETNVFDLTATNTFGSDTVTFTLEVLDFERKLDFAEPASVARNQPMFRRMLANLADGVWDKNLTTDAFQFAPVPTLLKGFPGDVVTFESYSTENEEQWTPVKVTLESSQELTRAVGATDILFSTSLYDLTSNAWPTEFTISNISYTAGVDYSISIVAGNWVIDWSLPGKEPVAGTIYSVPFVQNVSQVSIGDTGSLVIGWLLDGTGLNYLRAVYNQAQFVSTPLTIRAYNFYLWFKAYASIWQQDEDEANQIYLDGYIGWPKRYVVNVIKGEEDGMDEVASTAKYHLKTTEGAGWVKEIVYNDVTYLKTAQWDIVEADSFFQVDWNVGAASMPWQASLRRSSLGATDIISWNRKYRSLSLKDQIIAQNDGYTALLIHCDGLDAATTFTDDSGFGRTVSTVIGTPKVDAGIKRFGTGSVVLDGVSALSIVDTDGLLRVGDADFVLETQLELDTLPGVSPRVLMQYDGNWQWTLYSSGGIIHSKFEVPGWLDLDGIISITASTWNHLACMRFGNIFRIYFNGVAIAESSVSGNIPVGVGSTLRLGNNDLGTAGIIGRMDEIRVSYGTPRWEITEFTLPTEAYASYDAATLYSYGADYVQASSGTFTFPLVKGRAGSRDILGRASEYPVMAIPETLIISAVTYRKGVDYKLSKLEGNWVVDWNTGVTGSVQPVRDTVYSVIATVSEIYGITWLGAVPIAGTDYVSAFNIPAEPPANAVYEVRFDGALLNTDQARLAALRDNWTNFLRVDFPSWIVKRDDARRFVAMVLDAYTWANTKKGLILGAQAFHPLIPEPLFMIDWKERSGYVNGHGFLTHEGTLKPDLYRYFVAAVTRSGSTITGMTPFDANYVTEIDLRYFFTNDTSDPDMAENFSNLLKIRLDMVTVPQVYEYWIYRQRWTDTRNIADRESYHVVGKIKLSPAQIETLTNHWFTVMYMFPGEMFGRIGKVTSQTSTQVTSLAPDGTVYTFAKASSQIRVVDQQEPYILFVDDGKTLEHTYTLTKGANGTKDKIVDSHLVAFDLTAADFNSTMEIANIVWHRAYDFEFIEENPGFPNAAWYVDWAFAPTEGTPPVNKGVNVTGSLDFIIPKAIWGYGTDLSLANFLPSFTVGGHTYSVGAGQIGFGEGADTYVLAWVHPVPSVPDNQPPLWSTYHVQYTRPEPLPGTVYDLMIPVYSWYDAHPVLPNTYVDLPHPEIVQAEGILLRHGTARIMYMTMLIDLTYVAEQVTEEGETEILTNENLYELRNSMEIVLNNVVLSPAALKIVFIVPTGRFVPEFAEESAYVS